MSTHSALTEGRVAVVTGAASGIGLAAARRFASMGLKVCLADLSQQALERAVAEVAAASPKGPDAVIAVPTDVSKLEDVQALRDAAYRAFGEVGVLMNNAGTAPGGGPWEHIDRWRRVLEVNLWGVINGVHAFIPRMLEHGLDGLVINTGSKQGITCPPGNTAYNVSKAGVKVFTESLQHQLRNTAGCRLSAYLLVPGWTDTAINRKAARDRARMNGDSAAPLAASEPRPAGAWTSDQVIDYLLASIEKGKFYILCPDNDVSEALDRKRIAWAAGDLIEGRPPLSRWHSDFAAQFKKFSES